MPDRKFPIVGDQVPPMLGRGSAMQRIVAALSKPTPDHLQVVGPRFAGKTVFLHELARRVRSAGKPYTAIILWDLGHQTPGTDEDFMQRFARELANALSVNHPDYADHLRTVIGNPFRDIAEVLDALEGDGGKVLAILDGFDKALSNGRLTRNLWDQFRELAAKPSLRLVTASRNTLRELIRNPEAQTSDFWNIFDPTPVRIGCFNEADIDAVLAQVTHIRLSTGARTELSNATNGFPVMVLEVINVLFAEGGSGEVSHQALADACSKAYPMLRDKIESMWADCSSTAHDLLARVLREGAVLYGPGMAADANLIVERGFAIVSGNKLQRPNRLLTKFFDDQPSEGSALARLFAAEDDYKLHLKEALLHRVHQIVGLDSTLRRYLERSAADLPEYPDVLLSNVRGIVDRAFELIWQAELVRKAIPSDWISLWKYNNERNIEELQTTFPQGIQRVRLLNLMTGTEKSPPRAKRVSKSTHVLMSAAHGFANFGQHMEGEVVTGGTAYAALHLSIELAASLSRDLTKPLV
jgi:hypothetical protein